MTTERWIDLERQAFASGQQRRAAGSAEHTEYCFIMLAQLNRTRVLWLGRTDKHDGRRLAQHFRLQGL